MVYQKKYEWAGYSYKVPAQVVGEHVAAIEERDGEVTKESFLDSARSKKSPVHALFEWDNRKAGEKWRLQQAKNILSCLRIQIVNEGQNPIRTRAYINTVPGRDNGRFLSIETAMSRVDTREGVLTRAKAELTSFTEKYRTLEELTGVIEVIDDFLNEEE